MGKRLHAASTLWDGHNCNRVPTSRLSDYGSVTPFRVPSQGRPAGRPVFEQGIYSSKRSENSPRVVYVLRSSCHELGLWSVYLTLYSTVVIHSLYSVRSHFIRICPYVVQTLTGLVTHCLLLGLSLYPAQICWFRTDVNRVPIGWKKRLKVLNVKDEQTR
jgi:hypothetical protein